jgi:flagellar biosynthesis GTPase FlhF
MKLEYLTVESIKNGMKEVVTRFGADAVLLKTVKEGTKYRLLIAHKDTNEGDQQAAVNPSRHYDHVKSALDDKPLTLAEIDLVTGERRVAISPTQLNPASAQTLKTIVREESMTARRASKFDKLDQALLNDKRAARQIRRLKCHPEFEALNTVFDTSGISSLFRQSLLAGLAGSGPEESLQDKTADFIASKLPSTHEIDLSQTLHFLAGGYGVGKTSLAFKMALQINSYEPGRAIVVNYSSDQEASWTNAAIIGARLGVEVLPASSAADLAELVRDNESTKLLLVDISTYNEGDIASLQSRFKKAAFHLVAPSDACLNNLQRLSRAHAWDSLMITRLDSASFSWSIYQVLVESQIPLSIGSRDPSLNAGVVVVSAVQLRGLLDKVLSAIIAPGREPAANSSSAKPRSTMERLGAAQQAAAMH